MLFDQIIAGGGGCIPCIPNGGTAPAQAYFSLSLNANNPTKMTERGDKFTVSEALKLIFDGEKDDVESNRDSGGEFAVEEESENDHVFEEESTDSDIAEPAKETIPTTPVRGRTITRGTARS